MTRSSAKSVSRIRPQFAQNAQEFSTMATNTPTSSERETLATPIISDQTLESMAAASDNAVASADAMLSLFNFAQAETAKIVTRGAGSFDPRIVEFVKLALQQRANWPLSSKGHRTLKLALFPIAPTDDLTRMLTRADFTPVAYKRWESINAVVSHVVDLIGLTKATSPAKPGQIRIVAVSSPTSARGEGNSFTLQIV
jgi:hypothetical protein